MLALNSPIIDRIFVASSQVERLDPVAFTTPSGLPASDPRSAPGSDVTPSLTVGLPHRLRHRVSSPFND